MLFRQREGKEGLHSPLKELVVTCKNSFLERERDKRLQIKDPKIKKYKIPSPFWIMIIFSLVVEYEPHLETLQQ